MRHKRVAVVVVAVLLVAAVVTVGVKLLVPGVSGGVMPNHITVSAAKADVSGQVRVGGDVVPGSITWDSRVGALGFLLTGEGGQLQVKYPGTAPKDFKPGAKIVVEGIYTGSVFQAASLTTTNSPLCKACHQ